MAKGKPTLKLTEDQYAQIVRQMEGGMRKLMKGGGDELSLPYMELQNQLEMHPLADMILMVEMEGGGFMDTIKNIGSQIWKKYGKEAVRKGTSAAKDVAKSAVKDAMADGTQAAAKGIGKWAKDTGKKHGIDTDQFGVQDKLDSMAKTATDMGQAHADKLIDKGFDKIDKTLEGSGMQMAGNGHMYGKGHMEGDGMKMAGHGMKMAGHGMKMAGDVQSGKGMRLSGGGPNDTDEYVFRSMGATGLPVGAVTVSQFNHLNFAPQAIAGNSSSY
tara:strand:+ start:8062 stop:8877 length:816 start_codon:yes stop_codon:yes gene_type:complete